MVAFFSSCDGRSQAATRERGPAGRRKAGCPAGLGCVVCSRRTTPLRGLWQHAPYFHDGSAPDLLAVINHYDQQFNLSLTRAQKADLVEFLKSL
jgi:hypothetical protein